MELPCEEVPCEGGPLPSGGGLVRLEIVSPDTKARMHFDVSRGLDFKKVTDEIWREFVFPDGSKVRVDRPALTCVKAPPAGRSGGGSLRIICLDGTVTYIPYGWISLRWMPRPGHPAVAF